jgi:hypothetical protein
MFRITASPFESKYASTANSSPFIHCSIINKLGSTTSAGYKS